MGGGLDVHAASTGFFILAEASQSDPALLRCAQLAQQFRGFADELNVARFSPRTIRLAFGGRDAPVGTFLAVREKVNYRIVSLACRRMQRGIARLSRDVERVLTLD